MQTMTPNQHRSLFLPATTRQFARQLSRRIPSMVRSRKMACVLFVCSVRQMCSSTLAPIATFATDALLRLSAHGPRLHLLAVRFAAHRLIRWCACRRFDFLSVLEGEASTVIYLNTKVFIFLAVLE
mmetsp:Transcript_23763/g.64012  ORF Transcript_23763/g.64012 Transcript_23763/m.64012 type:complete len:126 (+) Transcript_23763:426-803(+)